MKLSGAVLGSRAQVWMSSFFSFIFFLFFFLFFFLSIYLKFIYLF